MASLRRTSPEEGGKKTSSIKMATTNESIKIRPLEYTPEDAIHKKVAELKETFYDSKTRPVEFRKVQLRKLYWA